MKLIQSHLKQLDKIWLLDLKKTEDNLTALHIACLNSHTDMVKLLVEVDRVDVNSKSWHNQTPLHFAVARLNLDACETLLNAPRAPPRTIDLNIQDNDGHTPLQLLLLSYSIGNMRKSCQRSPSKTGKPIEFIEGKLDSFSRPLNIDVCAQIGALLISRGANIELKNKKQLNAFELCNEPSLVKILEEESKKQLRFHDQKSKGGSSSSLSTSSQARCMACLIRDREVLLKPCKHLIVCTLCSRTLDSCTTCQQRIDERLKLEKCIKCRVRTCSRIFEPCGHVNACRECASGFRACPECKLAVDRVVSIDKYGSPSNSSKDDSIFTSAVYLKTVQRSIIKEKALCSVCSTRFKDIGFVCGHSFCGKCGSEKLDSCPNCETHIKKGIILV